jgi:preprotein translocase subunit YajC
MWTDAYAQAGGAAPSNLNPAIVFLIQYGPILLLLVIMYLLIIRPQQQRQKKLDEMLKGLKKGDRVLTSGGMFGTIVGLDEHKVVLKVADEVKIEFARSAVASVVGGDAK